MKIWFSNQLAWPKSHFPPQLLLVNLQGDSDEIRRYEKITLKEK